MMSLLPEKFDGNKNFEDWVSHLECVAAINYWNDAEKLLWLLWLQAYMMVKAHVAYQCFTHEIRESYALSKDALRERFKPPSKTEFYKAEFQSWKKEDSETWENFGDELLDRAYADL